MVGGPEKSRQTPNLIVWTVLIFSVPGLLILRSALFGGDFITMMLGIPLLLFCGVFAGLGALVAAVRCLWTRRWHRAAWAAGLLGLVILTSFRPLTFVHTTNYLGAGVNLAMFGLWYHAHLPPKAKEPRLAVFDRGGLITGGVAMVYDESDEIVLPPERQSKAWKARAENSELACGYSASPLWGHYYDAWISC